jgi:uncharacterized protein YneF (UPF0154 family)
LGGKTGGGTAGGGGLHSTLSLAGKLRHTDGDANESGNSGFASDDFGDHAMKTFLVPAVCLLVGLAIGFFAGDRYNERHVTNEAVELMMSGREASERLDAVRGIRAIECIDAGNTQRAIEVWLRPIADFYSQYANLTHNDNLTKELLTKIEQFSKTNQVVAERIRASTNEIFKLPPGWPNTPMEPTATAD